MPRRWECRFSHPRVFFWWFISWKAWKKLSGQQISGENRGRVSEEERLCAPAGWWDNIIHTKISAPTVNTQLTLLLLFLCAYNSLQWPETKLWFSTATIWAHPKYFFFPLPLCKNRSCSFLCSRQPYPWNPWNAACLLPACVPSSQLLTAFWLIDRHGSLISDNSTYDKLNNHLMNWLTSEGFDLMHNPSHR